MSQTVLKDAFDNFNQVLDINTGENTYLAKCA